MERVKRSSATSPMALSMQGTLGRLPASLCSRPTPDTFIGKAATRKSDSQESLQARFQPQPVGGIAPRTKNVPVDSVESLRAYWRPHPSSVYECVINCREMGHSEQIVESNSAVTDQQQKPNS
jgi:hypothetical protein